MVPFPKNTTMSDLERMHGQNVTLKKLTNHNSTRQACERRIEQIEAEIERCIAQGRAHSANGGGWGDGKG